MAKELPYFKFEPNQWDNGNIQMCTREEKGLFIDLCSMYWSRLGDVPIKLALQKLCGGNATALNPLISHEIIRVIDDMIFIEFLDEQIQEFDNMREINSQNALKGWEKRRKNKGLSEPNATALNPQSETDAIREDKRRGDKKKLEKKEDKILNPDVSNLKIEDFLNERVYLEGLAMTRKIDYKIILSRYRSFLTDEYNIDRLMRPARDIKKYFQNKLDKEIETGKLKPISFQNKQERPDSPELYPRADKFECLYKEDEKKTKELLAGFFKALHSDGWKEEKEGDWRCVWVNKKHSLKVDLSKKM